MFLGILDDKTKGVNWICITEGLKWYTGGFRLYSRRNGGTTEIHEHGNGKIKAKLMMEYKLHMGKTCTLSCISCDLT